MWWLLFLPDLVGVLGLGGFYFGYLCLGQFGKRQLNLGLYFSRVMLEVCALGC
jgi:hypothetical protein